MLQKEVLQPQCLVLMSLRYQTHLHSREWRVSEMWIIIGQCCSCPQGPALEEVVPSFCCFVLLCFEVPGTTQLQATQNHPGR